jgi:hypothetical protein
MARGSWLNTGEGGLSEHHLVGGGDVVFQIGPGLFGVRGDGGEWSWDAFARQSEIEQVCGFELKFHQGAKIRGGHVEGAKVTPEIAAIRGVPPWQAIDSPNRFPMFRSLDDVLDHVARMRERGGKPVGLKLVIGGPGFLDEFAEAMARRGDGPDWRTAWGCRSARASSRLMLRCGATVSANACASSHRENSPRPTASRWRWRWVLTPWPSRAG